MFEQATPEGSLFLFRLFNFWLYLLTLSVPASAMGLVNTIRVWGLAFGSL